MKELYRQFNQTAMFLQVVEAESRCARHPDVEIDYSDGLPFCNVCWYVSERTEMKARFVRVTIQIHKPLIRAHWRLIKACGGP